MADEYGLKSLDGKALLSCLIWAEARGESLEGQVAVGNVVKNRVLEQKWYGKTWKEVMLKPFQFSCFNHDNPPAYFHKMLEAWHDRCNDPAMKQAVWIAFGVIDGQIKDNVYGCNHYHADYVKPKWIEGKTPVRIIERHLFYKL